MADDLVPMKRRKSGVAKTELRERSAPGSDPARYPLVHVTAVGVAYEIMNSRQLETRNCKVFKKDLLYFFALKPAYGLKDGDQKSHRINQFPFAFVVRPEAVPQPFHVYPFDTGAAVAGLFRDADPHNCLEDYELLPDHSAIAGQIRWAFGDPKAYFSGDYSQDLLQSVPTFETVTRSYLDIARMASAGSNQPDARASAIEVAYDHHVPLKDNVILAVIPRQYLEGAPGQPANDDFISKLKAESVPYRTYDWQPNLTPNSYRAEITKVIREFYDEGTVKW